jgi:hypothetical protein
MGWSIGFDDKWNRDIGYGVPAVCDHPDCDKEINRGLSYVCGGAPYGGDEGCGLYFCHEHLFVDENRDEPVVLCERCHAGQLPYLPKPDTLEWVEWKLTDESWQQWRDENPETVKELSERLSKIQSTVMKF